MVAAPLVEADKEAAEENYLLWRLDKGVAEGPNEIPKGILFMCEICLKTDVFFDIFFISLCLVY